jgi:hypothetical protein
MGVTECLGSPCPGKLVTDTASAAVPGSMLVTAAVGSLDWVAGSRRCNRLRVLACSAGLFQICGGKAQGKVCRLDVARAVRFPHWRLYTSAVRMPHFFTCPKKTFSPHSVIERDWGSRCIFVAHDCPQVLTAMLHNGSCVSAGSYLLEGRPLLDLLPGGRFCQAGMLLGPCGL